jgi:phage portal protein BeeE
LKSTEQVRERKKDSIGFGTEKATYQPYTNLSVDQIRDLIISTVWAEVCIDTIVDEVVKYDLYTEPTNETIDSFLDYPSDKEPIFMVRKKYLKDMLRWGNGACVIEYKSGKPNQLIVTPGYTLRVTDENPPTYKLLKIGSSSTFKQDAEGNDIELSNKELMHFAIDQDSDATLAPSPIERAYNDILADKESSKKLVEFVKRGFYKPAFISFKKGSSVNKKELEEFVEYLNGLMVEGAKMLGINKEVDLKEIPYWDAKDIIETQRWIGLKIASVYKVPPFMLNLVQDVGSLNAREQKARFLENVIMPILKYEAFVYSNVLVRKGFKKLDTAVTSNILGTRLNWDRARIARQLVGQGEEILTVDEARKMFFNLPPKGKTKATPKPSGSEE